MSMVYNSILVRAVLYLWRGFLTLWSGSLLKRWADRFYAALARWAEGSFLCSLFRQEGIFLRSYPDSLICRTVTAVVDFPPTLVRLIFRRVPAFAEGSILCRILRPELGSTPVSFLSWVFLLMLCVPHDMWNNTYGLLLAVAALALFWIGSLRSSRRKLQIASMGPWWLCFVCFLGISFLISFDHSTSLRYLCFHLTGLIFAVVLVSAVETEGELIRFTAFGAAGMAVASLYGLYQSYVGVKVDILLVDVRYNADMPGRIYSFFENPNTLAQILVMLVPLSIGLIFASRTFWGKLAALVVSGLGLLALVLTYSRGCWLGIAVAALVFVALYRYQLLPLFILAAAALIPFLPETILTRILSSFNFRDTSISSRFPIYEASMRAILHDPVLGVGLGSELVWASFARNGFYNGTLTFVHLHNILLQLWIECGLFGMLSFVGTSLSAFKESARAAARSRSALKPLLIGGASALAGALMCGMTDYIWYYPRALFIFWFLMGILFAGIRLVREENTVSL